MKPAIFLDKDGTLLANCAFNVNPVRMRFADGAFAGLRRLATLDMPLIVISNQPGIALGKFSIEDLAAMHQELARMFLQAGAMLRGFYYCPHHPAGVRREYAAVCQCRKPAPGLLLRAARELQLSLADSWFIGDILDDIEAGHRAGCRTMLLDNGNETEWVRGPWRTPDRVERDLDAASQWLQAHVVGSCQAWSPQGAMS